jgi:hypothetical protein
MDRKMTLALILGLLICAPLSLPLRAYAQAVEVEEGNAPEAAPAPSAESNVSGKERAGQYFQKRQAAKADRTTTSAKGSAPRYLAIHVGTLFADQAYKWGTNDQKDIGGLNAGVTYRLGEWVNSMDFAMRIEYTNYSMAEGSARKLSFSGLITFPDANSRFPLYFGAGLGPGFFIKQLHDESTLALDYQLVAGARFLDVFDNLGFMVETGIKNHLLLLKDGQYNGVFVNVGTVFAF